MATSLQKEAAAFQPIRERFQKNFMETEMKHIILFVLLCCGLLCFSGCGEKFPADFPKVYPLTVKVTDGDTPLSDVKISFLALGGGGFAVGGETNASGTTNPITAQGAFTASGIPAGEYVVTVQDVVKVDVGVPPEEIAKMSRSEQAELEKKRQELIKNFKKKVPDSLCQSGAVADRSPIRFTASEKKNELTIDVAEYKK